MSLSYILFISRVATNFDPNFNYTEQTTERQKVILSIVAFEYRSAQTILEIPYQINCKAKQFKLENRIAPCPLYEYYSRVMIPFYRQSVLSLISLIYVRNNLHMYIQ